MSTFSGFIPELPGIAIDCFEEKHRREARIFFLSHCHVDHMRGLEIKAPLLGPLFLSPISEVLIRHRFSHHAEMVRSLNVGEHLALTVPPFSGEEAYELHVRSISAEHCPGSVMFYFETNAIRILYTGDFRLSSQKNFEEQSSDMRPEIVYLDSTFLDIDYAYFPTRDESTHLILKLCTEWLAADQRNVISLWLPASYGSEELFMCLFERLKEKIHISNKQRGPYLHFASLDKVLTCDSSVRIHACNGTARGNREQPCPILSKRANKLFIRTIRPSALTWRGLQQTDQFWKEANGLFYVCYSAHASCDELTNFLRYLQPNINNIRFNVIAGEIDRMKKKKIVTSILEEDSLATTSTGKKITIPENNRCLQVNRIEYKSKQDNDQQKSGDADSSSSEDLELYRPSLPKRKCTD